MDTREKAEYLLRNEWESSPFAREVAQAYLNPWISVDERLPEKGEICRVWWSKTQLPYDSHETVTKFNGAFNPLITHWTHKSNPPKE